MGTRITVTFRRRVLAAVAVLAVLLTVLVTGPSAVAESAPIPAGDRIRIEVAHGTEGIALDGIGSFRGAIEVVRDGSGVAVLNEVRFDDYLRGISEVPNAWPFEALKAQAVAARTYALWELRRNVAGEHRRVGADICATQSCQVYTGLTKERSALGDRWVAAADQTSGRVLWWRNGPILAKYSSSNGGEAVDGGQPYLRRFADPDDAVSPLHRWAPAVPAGQVAAALGLAPRTVAAIQRAGDVVLVTAKNDPLDPAEEPALLTLGAADFRSRLNASLPAPAGLPKVLPTVRYGARLENAGTPDAAVVFDGRGWGHGIGMSQWGAYGKAARGMKADDILAAYYAGLRPVDLPRTAEFLPETIKVALRLDAPTVTVRPADGRGALRITDAAGAVLSHGASAVWTLAPAAKAGVAAAPSEAEQAPAAVSVSSAPESIAVGEPVALALQLSHDAQVTARAIRPDGVEVPVGDPAVRRAGELRVTLPATPVAGTYRLVMDTDRGAGRVSSTTFELAVGRPAGPAGADPPLPAESAAAIAVTPTDGGPGTAGPAALAALLLVLAAAGTARAARRSRSVSTSRP